MIVLALFNMLNWQMALITVGISMLYSYLRDFSITRYSAKQLDKFYDYAEEKFDDLDLYIPLLEKTYQGYFLKRAALIINDGSLIIEAFRQKRKKDQDQISISVKHGEKFVIDYMNVDKNNKSITIDSTFSGQYYRFSVINHPKLLDKINEAKRGGK